MRKLVLIVSFVALGMSGGCAALTDKPSSVIMQNPETMEFVNCDVDEWGTSKSYARNEQCVEDYKKQGYIVWGEH